MPEVSKNDVVVKQLRDTLRVLKWEPARGTRAGLDLFILIDGSSRHRSDSAIRGGINSYAIYLRGIELREQRSVLWIGVRRP